MKREMYTIPIEDLQQIKLRLSHLWPQGKSVIMTGATGFFGRWLVESIHWIESSLESGNNYTVFSRQNQFELKEKMPALGTHFFNIVQKDLTKTTSEKFSSDYVLHAASEVYQFKGTSSVTYDYSSALKITQNLVNSVNANKIVYLSSGAVYSAKESALTEENSLIDFDVSQIDSYGEAKRASENYLENYGIPYVIARCFSFVGPWGDKQMAINDMLLSSLKSEKIQVRSPDVIRSYLYMTDLVVAALTLLFSDTKHNCYNVGSNQPISMFDLAKKICHIAKAQADSIQVGEIERGKALAGKFYWPETHRYQSEFGSLITVDLDESLHRTYQFLKMSQAV